MSINPKDFNLFECEGKTHLSIGDNYRYSALGILTHIMTLPGINVLAKKSFLLTDDFQAEFEYKGYVFVLYTPMDSVDISPYDSSVSNETTNELYQHIKTYDGISIFKSIGTIFKCLFIPFSYKP